MNKKIWLSSPHMSGQELKYITAAFESNWLAPIGPEIDEFENGLEHYVGENKHVAVVTTGTAAIHLALILAGVSKGDEVLCQSFTFSATVNPIVYQGAIPVFIDSESETWNMCPHLLEEAIKDRIAKGKKPKAILAVHLYGMPYNIERIHQLSTKYKIPVIEDAASALGSEVNHQKCGSFGDYGILSFNGNKIITTSGGGALITSSPAQKEKAIFLATQARDQAPHYQYSSIGYNYRMSNVLAGIGRGQLEVLQERVTARRANFEFYKKELASFPDIEFLDEPKGYTSNRWLTCILTPSFEIREKIRIHLETATIESRPLWKPMHQQPIFKEYPANLNGTAADLFERGLCLPSGSNLSKDDLERVVNGIKESLSD